MSLHFNFEFLGAATAYFNAATAYFNEATAYSGTVRTYAAQPQLILWTKPIFVLNQIQVEGSFEAGVELVLGQYSSSDNIEHSTNHTKETKPNQA